MDRNFKFLVGCLVFGTIAGIIVQEIRASKIRKRLAEMRGEIKGLSCVVEALKSTSKVEMEENTSQDI